VPIMVGAIDQEQEEAYGKILAPYLERDDTLFVISSDFCHWYVCDVNCSLDRDDKIMIIIIGVTRTTDTRFITLNRSPANYQAFICVVPVLLPRSPSTRPFQILTTKR
jgi:AmmeMemoRadiSam system protein B